MSLLDILSPARREYSAPNDSGLKAASHAAREKALAEARSKAEAARDAKVRELTKAIAAAKAAADKTIAEAEATVAKRRREISDAIVGDFQKAARPLVEQWCKTHDHVLVREFSDLWEAHTARVRAELGGEPSRWPVYALFLDSMVELDERFAPDATQLVMSLRITSLDGLDRISHGFAQLEAYVMRALRNPPTHERDPHRECARLYRLLASIAVEHEQPHAYSALKETIRQEREGPRPPTLVQRVRDAFARDGSSDDDDPPNGPPPVRTHPLLG